MTKMYLCKASKNCGKTDCYHAKPHEWSELHSCGNTLWCPHLVEKAREIVKEDPELAEKVMNLNVPFEKMAPATMGQIINAASTRGFIKAECEEVKQ